jgi:hypothetical protein
MRKANEPLSESSIILLHALRASDRGL